MMKEKAKLPLYSIFFISLPLFLVACKRGETLKGVVPPTAPENYCCLREEDVRKDQIIFKCVDKDPNTPENPGPNFKDKEYYLVYERIVMEKTREPGEGPRYDDRMTELECEIGSYADKWVDAWRTLCRHCCVGYQRETEDCEIPAPPGSPWGCGSQGLYTGCMDKRFIFLRPEKKADGTPNPKPEPGKVAQNVEFAVALRTDPISSGRKAGGLVPWCMECANCKGTWKEKCTRGSWPPNCQAPPTSSSAGIAGQACDPNDDPICTGADSVITFGSPPIDYNYDLFALGKMKPKPSFDPGSTRVDLGTYTMSDGVTKFWIYKNIIRGLADNDEFLFLTKIEVPENPVDLITYLRYSKVYDVGPGAKNPTLQLEPFYPPRPAPEAGWWNSFIPECKPLIYLYPEEETILTLVPKPAGYVTVSEPAINPYQGWKNVTAYPDGTLKYQEKEHRSLYYESLITKLFVPQEGFIVKKEDLKEFFDEYLPRVGLNEKESREFKEYWLSRLTGSPYYFVRFLTKEEIEKIEPLDISVKPETIIRVRAYFRALKLPVDISIQKIPELPQREGFTLVEWGGLYEDPENPAYLTFFEVVKNTLKQLKYWLTK